jgi:anaerobic magnesium-protoporphyrin IX monomethyl ester cyclase
MIDCLLVGFNDVNYTEYVRRVFARGPATPAARDLALNFIDYDGAPRRSMDMLNLLERESGRTRPKPLHNADFLWPVITYLGTYLDRRGFTFDYVNLFHFEQDRLERLLTGNEVLAVAITTTLYFSPYPVLDIIASVRRHNPEAAIIVGGPYIRNQLHGADARSAQQLLTALDADYYVISGEGEAALVGILRALQRGEYPEHVPNVAYRHNPGEPFRFTPTAPESNGLAENMVDYSLFPKGDIGQFISLRTAKSCPFSCAFCNFPQMAGKYTYLDVGKVEEELNEICELGQVTTLTFIDDTFNVPKTRFNQMLRMMIANGYGFRWNAFYRCDHGDAETIDLMADAGCEGVFLGVESGSDEMLARMNKTARRAHYLRAIPQLRDRGILTNASVIVGFPGETQRSVEETISLLEEARPDFYGANLWFCDQKTPVWSRRAEYAIEGAGLDWRHATMSSSEAFDWIERMFLSIDRSVWLPEDGFELWSVFYLQRYGMDRQQVREFARSFNAAVREKLLSGKSPAANSPIVAELRHSCAQLSSTCEVGEG